jgi:CubicO group peptidase (beta-lactamase class C family)
MMIAMLIFASLAAQTGLVGDWSAQTIYGPVFAGGRISIVRNHAWVAAAAGMVARAPAGENPDFAFQDGSELRIEFMAGRLTGQWIQPGNQDNRYSLATPIKFSGGQHAQWAGVACPQVDVQHLTMVVRADGGGNLTAIFLNPEENAGLFVGVRSLVANGASVRLRRQGSNDIVGRWEPSLDTIVINDPGLPGTFVFKRSIAQTQLYHYNRPVQTTDGWPTARLQDVGLNQSTIVALVRRIMTNELDLHSPHIQGLLIARHGRLVLDAYADGFTADRPHDMRSAGKSVTTLLVGKAIQEGASFTPSSSVSSLLQGYTPFANDSPEKERITVGDLMSMSAGYACDDNDDASPGNEDTMQSQIAQPDWYKFTLDLPMVFAPGSRALYCSAEINLLGAIIQDKTNLWLPDFFYENFAHPMQFAQYALWLMPTPTYTAYMAGGDEFLPRDFLKFGQLLLDGGRWHTTKILNQTWVNELATKHSFVEDGGGDYGWGWHLSRFSIGGRTLRAISAGGNGGQLLYVFPQLDMVVLITAGNYGDYRTWSKFAEIPDNILSAVTDF